MRNIYNVLDECGYTDTTVSQEKNIERANAVDAWIKANFSDIFESVVTTPTSASVTNSVYFKGTNNGIYITQQTTAGASSNGVGFIHSSANSGTEGSVVLARGEVNLLVLKSKYGFIAGFYKSTIANVRTLAANLGDKLLTFALADNEVGSYLSDIQTSATLVRPQVSPISDVYLVPFAVPQTGMLLENVYLSMGATANNCGIFSAEGASGQFAEVRVGTSLCGICLKVEEATAEDYAGLTPLHGGEANE